MNAVTGYLKKILPIVIVLFNFKIYTYSNLTNNDPYPLYTCIDPQDYLTEWYKAKVMNHTEVPSDREVFQFSANVLFQKANRGTDIYKHTAFLGDLQGRWNILGLFFDPTAAQNLITNLKLTDTSDNTCLSFIMTPTNTDSSKRFGFLEVPVIYKKYGVRFQTVIQFSQDFGFKLDFGVVDIKQTASFVDLTCSASGTSCIGHSDTPGVNSCALTDGDCCNNTQICVEQFEASCKKFVMNDIMKQLCVVASTVGLDIDDYHCTGIEDIRAMIYWRKPCLINEKRPEYPEFLITPFFTGEFGIPTNKVKNYNKVFEISPGNNGHASIGFTTGFNVCFIESVAIGFEASMTSFFAKNISQYRLPNDCYQSGIFPTAAAVNLKPGTNWRFSAELAAYHFLDKLSFFTQYSIVSHSQDKICLQNPNLNPFYLVDRAQWLTKWEAQLMSSSLYYDISPNIKLGFVWQAPLGRRNAYRTTTIMGTIVATF